MDFSKALTYPFDDQDWLKKLLFLLVAGFIPIIGNPIAVQGWAVETARRVKAGEPNPMASWDDIGAVISRGFPLFLASIVYFIPSWILFCLAYVIPIIAAGGAAGSNSDTAASAVGGVASIALFCCGCLGLLALIAGAVVFWGGYVRFLDKPEFGTFMEFGENFAMVQNNMGDFGMALLYIVGAGLIAGLASSITFGIGGLLATPFMGYFSSHILGQLAAKLGGARPAAAAPQV
jgi:hypothetical protein